VDQGLHHLQGKAELVVKPTDLLSLIHGVLSDKLALYRRHEEGARRVAGYAFNNTYQYILARESAHLFWLREAVTGLGGTPAETVDALPVPVVGKKEDADAAVAADDARHVRAFLERWRPRVAEIPHARHRKMLELMFGECAEHLRFFEQAAAGQLELLGRRMDGAGTGDGVIATRWLE
jgi:hypothetical protein